MVIYPTYSLSVKIFMKSIHTICDIRCASPSNPVSFRIILRMPLMFVVIWGHVIFLNLEG
jgi:hypothetical protein